MIYRSKAPLRIGLAGGGTTGSVALNLAINAGVTQTCSAGNHISAITGAGIATCTADAGGGGGITNSAGANVITNIGNVSTDASVMLVPTLGEGEVL